MIKFSKKLLCLLLLAPLFAYSNTGHPSIPLVTKSIESFVKNRSETNDQIKVTIASNTNVVPKKLPNSLSVSCFKSGKINGKTVFLIKYKDIDQQWKSFQVIAKVERFCDVLIINKNINPKQVITEEMVTPVVRPANWARRERAVSLNEAIGKRTNRLLVKGRVLFESMLENVPVLERGEKTTLVVISKNMSITMPVVVCQSAGIGQEVKVKSESLDKYYKAIVKDKDTCILRL